MEYQNLEKHFTLPKTTGYGFFECNRAPRKFKKKWKHILQGNRYDFLTLNQKLWFIQWHTNPNYNRFIIKQIIK